MTASSESSGQAEANAVERALRGELRCRKCQAWKAPKDMIDRRGRFCWDCWRLTSSGPLLTDTSNPELA